MRDVFVGIASFGNRVGPLRRAVESLIDQVDLIGVYLNHYDEVPEFLHDSRIVVARSEEHGDQRDNGKFFFLHQATNHYYAAADDDIEYPPDYIERLVSLLADAGPNSAVGVHGAIYPTQIRGLSKPRTLFHYRDSLRYVMPVHLIGTGTLLFDQTEWNLRFDEFEEPGMADVWFARSARRREARLFVINRNKRWLDDISVSMQDAEAATGLRLFAEARVDDSRQVQRLMTGGVSDGGLDRLVQSFILSDEFAESMPISQALLFDQVRRDLGWHPLSQSVADQIRDRITGLRSNWPRTDPIDQESIEAYTAAATGVMNDDLPAEETTRALRLLRDALALSERKPDKWKALPHPVRFDSRRERFYRLRPQLVRRSFRRSRDDARTLWALPVLTGEVDLDLALLAEQAGVETRFEDLPQLKEAAERNWLEAASSLRLFFETRHFSKAPDTLAWRRAFGDAFDHVEVQLLLCWLNSMAGEGTVAVDIVQDLRQRRPADIEVSIMESLLAATERQRTERLELVLEPLDALLERLGLSPYRAVIGESSGTSSTWLDWLPNSPPPRQGVIDLPSVTVILTAHNAESTLAAAMASVLASRDVDIQLIVVDDGSDDSTGETARRFADDRVTVLENARTLGPYVSRNRALEVATGEFVTIADADDWSHPDRIRFQVDRLQERPHVWGCTVAHMRLLSNGLPDLENHLRFLGHGPVSLLFRRRVVDHIGYFDHVRTRGDIEYIRRLRARFGWEAIRNFEVPLILASSSGTSNSKRFTADALSRYRRASREWHTSNALSDALYVGLSADQRAAFIAPAEMVVFP